MNWGMEVLSPQASYISRASWMTDESRGATRWTQAENKIFESALALHDKDTPDRFHKVAEMLPGKTVGDVIKQYKELVDDVSNIEAGLVPIPGYDCNSCSSFTLEWVNHAGYKQAYCPGGKRGPPRSAEQERKKGVPWTEEEHRLFLMGLNKYGKGDWRNISRNFVVSRTPTQVASHAQKYFIRQLSGAKDKRRASIHDITTVTLESQLSPSPDNKSSNSPQQTAATIQSQKPCSAAANAMPGSTFQWDEPSNNITGGGAAAAGFSYNTTSTYQQGHAFISPYGLQSYPQNLQRGGW